MSSSIRKLAILVAVSLAAFLTVGATAASAHGGHGYCGGRLSTSALVTQGAKQLGVTRGKLKQAIVDSAVTAVDAAVADEDLEADEAGDLKVEAQDNLRVAYDLSKTKTVAANLQVTTAKLNAAFRAARKTLILAKIDNAVKEGYLDEAEAAQRKDELAQARLPGYKAPGRGFGHGYGQRGFGHRGL